MRRYISAASLALALVAVLGLAGPAAADDFKGYLEGDVTRTPLAPPFALGEVDATGEATHLGKFTLYVPQVVNTATRTGSGFYYFTAEDGDTLYAVFTGVRMEIEPGVIFIVETATITGGTGRFAGASGSFTVERLFYFATGTTTGSFEGTIKLP